MREPRTQFSVLLGLLAALALTGCGTGKISSAGDFPGEEVDATDEVGSTTLNPNFYDYLFVDDSADLQETTRLDFSALTFQAEQEFRVANRSFEDQLDLENRPQEVGDSEPIARINISAPLDADYDTDTLAQARLDEGRSAGTLYNVWHFPLDGEEWKLIDSTAKVGQSGQLVRFQVPVEGETGTSGLYAIFDGEHPGDQSSATDPTLNRFEVSSPNVAPGGEISIEVELQDSTSGPTLVLLDDGTDRPHGEFSDVSQSSSSGTITHTATWTAPPESGSRTIRLRASNRTGGYTVTTLDVTVTGGNNGGN